MKTRLELADEYQELRKNYHQLLCVQFEIDFNEAAWFETNDKKVELCLFLASKNPIDISFDEVRYIVDYEVSWDEFLSWYIYTKRLKALSSDISTPTLTDWRLANKKLIYKLVSDLENYFKRTR